MAEIADPHPAAAAGLEAAAGNGQQQQQGGGRGGGLWRVVNMFVMFTAINSVMGMLTGSSGGNTNNADNHEQYLSNSPEVSGATQSAAGSRQSSLAQSGAASASGGAEGGLMSLFAGGPAVNNFPKRITNIAPFMTEGDLLYFLVEIVEKKGEGEFAVIGTGGGGPSPSAVNGGGVGENYPIFTSGESLPTPPPADHSDFLNRLIKPYFSGAVYEDEALTVKLLEQRRAEEEEVNQKEKSGLPKAIEERKQQQQQVVPRSYIPSHKSSSGKRDGQEENEEHFFPFSLAEPIRNITKKLNLTSCYERNCTLIAKVNIFYQHPTARYYHNADSLSGDSSAKKASAVIGDKFRRKFPRRLLTIDVPIISFVERIETEMVSLLGASDEDDEGGEVAEIEGVVGSGLGLPSPSSGNGASEVAKQKRKKRGVSSVRQRTKRQRNKIDSAIDDAISWVKTTVLGATSESTYVDGATYFDEPIDEDKSASPSPVSAKAAPAVGIKKGSNKEEDDGSEEVTLLRSSSAAAAAAAASKTIKTTKSGGKESKEEEEEGEKTKTRYQALFHPTLTLSPVVDFSKFPIATLPAPISKYFSPVAHPSPTLAERARALLIGYDAPNTDSYTREQMERHVAGQKSLTTTELYSPVVYTNRFWELEEHLVPLNESNVGSVTLTVSIEPLSLMRFLMYTQFDDAMMRNEEWGTMTRYDRDMTKKIFLESNILLLIVTMVVSTLHSVFEFLAIKNDVSFWRNRKSFKGLSLRTIAVNLYFQAVIFLYLLDSEETSYMVLIPAGISVIVEGWKLLKTMKIGRDPVTKKFVFKFSASYDEKTRSYDQQAMRYLTYLLVPCLIGYSIYSAMYHSHKGWYSFLIACQVKFIYFSGFIMMTPQIFINYKLKSVTAVPWRTFVYRFLNTIVDDLFAFVITMPTLHRLACFRDDIVFLILLFQRWQYPVDHNRTEDGYRSPEENEDGGKAEVKEGEKVSGAIEENNGAAKNINQPTALEGATEAKTEDNHQTHVENSMDDVPATPPPASAGEGITRRNVAAAKKDE